MNAAYLCFFCYFVQFLWLFPWFLCNFLWALYFAFGTVVADAFYAMSYDLYTYFLFPMISMFEFAVFASYFLCSFARVLWYFL